LEGYWLDITASIGIAVYLDDSLGSNILLQNADMALCQAQKNKPKKADATTISIILLML
jgi:GGDEF domain-containing protein